jgi:hypothetical protein
MSLEQADLKRKQKFVETMFLLLQIFLANSLTTWNIRMISLIKYGYLYLKRYIDTF